MEIMNTRLVKHDIYENTTLTGISKRCDWFINGNQLLKLNDKEPKTIFVTGYKGGAGITHLTTILLPNIISSFVLIVASEDYTFPTGNGDVRLNEYKNCELHIKTLLESPLVTHIFVENLDITHPKMTPIPLGLLYPDTDMSNPDFYNIDFLNKNQLCFIRHTTRPWESNQWKDRLSADNLSKNEWASFVHFIDKGIPREEFIRNLKQSKFCL